MENKLFFQCFLLKKFISSLPIRFNNVVLKPDEKYEAKKVFKSRMKWKQVEYLIKLKNYPIEEAI